jgi:hypothetical protein
MPKPIDQIKFKEVGTEGCPPLFRLSRGNIVKVKGKRGVKQLTKVSGRDMWFTDYDPDTPMASRNRAAQEAMGRTERTGARAGTRGESKRASLRDVSHIAVSGRTRRRRRRY